MSSLVLQVRHPCRHGRGKRKKGCGLLLFLPPPFLPPFLPSFRLLVVRQSRSPLPLNTRGTPGARPFTTCPCTGIAQVPKNSPFLLLPNELWWLNGLAYKQQKVGKNWGFFSLNPRLLKPEQSASPSSGMPRSGCDPFTGVCWPGERCHTWEPGRATTAQAKTRSCFCSPTSGRGTRHLKLINSEICGLQHCRFRSFLCTARCAEPRDLWVLLGEAAGRRTGGSCKQ